MPERELVTNPAVLVIAPGGGEGLCLVHLETKSTFAIRAPVILDILVQMTEPATIFSLQASLESRHGLVEPMTTEFVSFLLQKRLLIPRGEAAASAGLLEALSSWRHYGWDVAAIYHFFTKDFPFLDYSRPDAYHRDQHLMADYKEQRPEPARYKDYVPLARFSLEVDKISLSTSLHALQDEGSGPPPCKLDLATLGTLLYYSAGKIGSIRFPIVEPLLRKTSPSGGARHPTEAYVAVFDIAGLPAGLYYYSVRDHCLEQLAAGSYRTTVLDALHTISERDELDPTVVIFFSSVVERNMWRYREPRSYRVIHLDLGHVTWTCHLVAQALALRFFAHHGMDDTLLESLFGLEWPDESFYWYVAIG